MAGPITVAICEDHEVFRRELMVSIERDPGLHVIAEADVPGHLGPVVAQHPPRVLCLDLTPPLGDPVDGVKRLSAAMPITSILLLAGPDDDPSEALLAGAAGAVSKITALAEASAIVRTVASGSAHLDASSAKALVAYVEQESSIGSNLTEKQSELLHQLAFGRSLEELTTFFGQEMAVLNQRLWETLHHLRNASGDGNGHGILANPFSTAPTLAPTPMIAESSAVPTAAGTLPTAESVAETEKTAPKPAFVSESTQDSSLTDP